jgi:MFS family permease
MQASDTAIEHYPRRRAAWYAVALFVLAIVIAFVDRQILALLVQPLRADFGISDTEIGLLQGFSIAILLAVMAVPVGRIVDRYNRRNLLIASILCWSAMTFLCGMAENFTQLFLWRLGVGLGEVGLFPAAYSLMADLFPRPRRMMANVVFYIGMLVGACVALGAGGLAIEFVHGLTLHHAALAGIAEWRLVFMVVALPGPLLALMFFTIREPSRKDRLAAGATTLQLQAFLRFLHDHARLLAGVLIGIAMISIVDNGLIGWMPSILARSFGMAASDAGVRIGLIAGIASVAGVGSAAALARLIPRDRFPALYLRIALLGVVIAMPLALLLPRAASDGEALLVFGLQFFGIYIANGLLPTVLQNITPNEFRGQLVAVQYLATSLIGAVGMLLVGHLSDAAMGENGLTIAFTAVAFPSLLVACAAFFCAIGPYRRLASRTDA